MKFVPLDIAGAWEVRVERHDDERGYFARLWCREEFGAAGIDSDLVQASASFNRVAGTVRGMHFSLPPAREGKLVRCAVGEVHDVVLDLRPGSTTFGQHRFVVLTQDEQNALYIPPGVAHGFQTLVDGATVHYMMTERYRPELAAGVRYDDPAFAIRWPLGVAVISERDRSYPDFDQVAHKNACLSFYAVDR